MKRTLLVCLMVMSIISLKAQEADQTEFEDTELKTFATVMVWAEGEKDRMTEQYNAWIQSNDTISSAKFSELNNASKEDKLGEVVATEDELTAFKNIQEKNDQQLAKFKEEYVKKIKGEITVGLYNDLNKAFKKDPALKDRYQIIFNELLETTTAKVEASAADLGSGS